LVSPVGQPQRKDLGEDWRGLAKEGSTKSPLEIEISMKEQLKLPWRTPWNREFFVGEREKLSVGLFWREKITGHGCFYR
jgi:hypothetical protein